MLNETLNKKSEDQLSAVMSPNGDVTADGYRLVTVEDLKRDAESIAMLQAANATTVSYTHLTLPTSDLV